VEGYVKILMSLLFFIMMLISCGEVDTGKAKDQADQTNFPNEHAGSFWSDRSLASMKWDAAFLYCEYLGGTLPTISELRTLITNCPLTEPGGLCGITDDCLDYDNCWTVSCDGFAAQYEDAGYSIFYDKQRLWSSSFMSDNENLTWNVDFSNGLVGYANIENIFYVRCIKQK